MYSYASVNCRRMAEEDRKTVERKCLDQNIPAAEWSFGTYLEPPVAVGQMNFDRELPNSGTQFFNSEELCFADYPAENSHIPIGCVKEPIRAEHGLLENPGSGITSDPLHNSYAYESCISGGSSFEQGNGLSRWHVPACARIHAQDYQDVDGYESPVPPLPHLSHPLHHHHRRHYPAEPCLEIGCSTVKEDSNFLRSLLLSDDTGQSESEEFPRCYSDLSHALRPPFINSPEPSVSLSDISQSQLQDDGLHHEVIRRSRRREQNRIAARKCREKKKENVDNMLKDYTETLKENERLRLETEKLQTLVAQLQTIMKCHQTTCHFSSAL